MACDYVNECYQNFAPQCQCYDWCYVPIFYPSSSEYFPTNCCEAFSPEPECIEIAEEDESLCKTGNEQTKVSVANYASGCATSGGKKTRRKEKSAKKSAKTRKPTGAGERKRSGDSKTADSENNGAENADGDLRNAAESNEKNNGESSEKTGKNGSGTKNGNGLGKEGNDGLLKSDHEYSKMQDFIAQSHGQEMLMVNVCYSTCAEECDVIKGPTILIGAKPKVETSQTPPSCEKFVCKIEDLESLQLVDAMQNPEINVYRTWYKGADCHTSTYHCEPTCNYVAETWQSKYEERCSDEWGYAAQV